MPRPLGIMLRTWNKLIDLMTGFSAGEADLEPTRQPAERVIIERVASSV